MTNPTLVLVLPSLRLYKSLCQSELVQELRNKFELKITISENELGALSPDFDEVYAYQESNFLMRIHKLALDVETFRNKDLNVSYETRIRMITNLPQPKEISIKSFVSLNSSYGVILSVLGSRIGYLMFGSIVRLLGSVHPGLTQILNSTSPDIIVCFSGGFYSGVENFLGRYARSNKVPFILIIDNWDNLSSKSVIWNKPTLMGVWGPEMATDAIELQGMDSSKVIEIGSSRLDLESPSEAPRWLAQSKPYVLFAGTGIQHLDELQALIETRLALNNLGCRELPIIYRPHPWNLRGDFRQKLSKILSTPGIILDQDIAENGPDSFYNRESLYHLENLVRNCSFLVAGHSTVIVEALYYGKKVLALTGSTHFLFNTTDSWIIYRHMSRLRGNPGITECNRISEICKALKVLLHSTVSDQNLVPHILPNFESSYQARVTQLINNLLNER